MPFRLEMERVTAGPADRNPEYYCEYEFPDISWILDYVRICQLNNWQSLITKITNNDFRLL